MFVFLPFSRWGETSRGSFSVVSFRLRIEQWFSDMCFDRPQSSAIWCLTLAESWCCEIKCSGWAPSRSPETLAISGRWQEPVLPLCRTKFRCLPVALSTSLPLWLSFILLYLSAFLSILSPAVSSVAGVTYKSCWMYSGWGLIQF